MPTKAIRITIILCLLLESSVIMAQKNKRDELDFLIKLTLFQNASGTKNYSPNYILLCDFLKLNFKMDTLESKGFDDFLFIRISSEFENPQNIDFKDGPILIANCKEFIVAINGRTVYRLKGFNENDFPVFLSTLKYFKYSNLSSMGRSTKYYSVTNLDLVCLYRAAMSFSIDKFKYPCLSTCAEVININ
jgi:hypothetical protein